MKGTEMIPNFRVQMFPWSESEEVMFLFANIRSVGSFQVQGGTMWVGQVWSAAVTWAPDETTALLATMSSRGQPKLRDCLWGLHFQEFWWESRQQCHRGGCAPWASLSHASVSPSRHEETVSEQNKKDRGRCYSSNYPVPVCFVRNSGAKFQTNTDEGNNARGFDSSGLQGQLNLKLALRHLFT